ncbi:metallophosphoesterase [Cellulophaga phage phi40:1]|uniref:Metallophosphoesterase n=1 Tax=Cellulophaga phage phi38:1 TaxID=1327977 RepID=S0A1I4_9CAUD|nr:NinI-like serine-threonine phosphatase [Cellulophaga phage phi38:1]AGO47888.1 metallophosphoesterase [Cellulophaga phage phi40:1]AGO48053.1 metallophosphoesterase [Cellulophaga phage phi38:1]
MRVFVMGDIHGSARALKQCLERSGFDKDVDKLIQLGDVADGWDDTPECVEILLSIKNLVAIRGNHDVWCHDWIKYKDAPNNWLKQGGEATVRSYVDKKLIQDERHVKFWEDQVDWYIDDENRLFVHAGWDYTHHGDFERQASLRVDAGSISRECHWDRELYRSALSLRNRRELDSFKPLKQFKEVYIGHTSHDKGEPFWVGNLCNMDTGAGWNGQLCIMDMNTREFWLSDRSKDLYPDSKGRG